MIFRDIQPHAGQFLLQFPGGVTAVVGQEEKFLVLIVQPLDKLRDAGQNSISVVDHPVHITDKPAFLIEIECAFHKPSYQSTCRTRFLPAEFVQRV